jgi:hypothetical protein
MKQPRLGRPVALADDELQPATGEVVECGVVLEGTHRIQQAQRGHRGKQPDGGRVRGDVAQDDRRRRRDERALVPLPDAVPVESQLLGEDRVLHHVAKALRGGFLDPGDRIRDMRDERDGQELHAGSPLHAAMRQPGREARHWTAPLPAWRGYVARAGHTGSL